MDTDPGYAKSDRKHAPHAGICIDLYHDVALSTRAFDEVGRDYRNELRRLGDQGVAKRFKGRSLGLLKNPGRRPSHRHRGARARSPSGWPRSLLSVREPRPI